MEKGTYLCKVSGMKYCDYMVLKWDGEHWWQYLMATNGVQGWFGVSGDIGIIKVVQLLEEEED